MGMIMNRRGFIGTFCGLASASKVARRRGKNRPTIKTDPCHISEDAMDTLRRRDGTGRSALRFDVEVGVGSFRFSRWG